MKAYCLETLGEDSFSVVAFSGVAAKNIDGETIHSFFRINPKPQFFKDLIGEELHMFQEKNQKLKVVFIDEYSLVGLRLLGMIDKRCREIKDNDEIMGNLCVVFLGDVNQLGPIFDKPLYTENLNVGSSPYAQRGKLVMLSSQICFMLKTPMRFNDDSYAKFRARLSSGQCTKNDVKC